MVREGEDKGEEEMEEEEGEREEEEGEREEEEGEREEEEGGEGRALLSWSAALGEVMV